MTLSVLYNRRKKRVFMRGTVTFTLYCFSMKPLTSPTRIIIMLLHILSPSPLGWSIIEVFHVTQHVNNII